MSDHWLVRLLRGSYAAWDRAGAQTHGAALAYYTAFSLAPLLVILLSVAGFVFGEKAANDELADELRGTLGVTVSQAVQDLVESADRRPGAGVAGLVVGVVVLLFGASGVFTQLQTALNAIWEVEPRGGAEGWWQMLRDRFLSFTMVLGTTFLLLVSLAVSAVLSWLGQQWDPGAGALLVLWRGLNLLVSLGVVWVLFAVLLKFLPDAVVSWKDALVGAAFTTALFTLGKELLAWYLGLTSVATAYGTAGSLAVVLLWVFYSSQIFLFGAALTREYASRHGTPARPAAGAVSTHPPEAAYGGPHAGRQVRV